MHLMRLSPMPFLAMTLACGTASFDGLYGDAGEASPPARTGEYSGATDAGGADAPPGNPATPGTDASLPPSNPATPGTDAALTDARGAPCGDEDDEDGEGKGKGKGKGKSEGHGC